MDVVCAACGADLTVAREFYNNASVLRPLEGIEVMPCCSCMSRAASEAAEEVEDRPPWGADKARREAIQATENDEYQRESAENGGLGR